MIENNYKDIFKEKIVESGFKNLQGRQEYFNAFVSRQLSQPPQLPFPLEDESRLERLAKAFDDYPNNSETDRRNLVVRSRRTLHELNKYFQPEVPMKPPSLRLIKPDISKGKYTSPIIRNL